MATLKVKRETTSQQAGLGKRTSAEDIKQQINVVVRGGGNGNGGKGNKVSKEKKRGSQASTLIILYEGCMNFKNRGIPYSILNFDSFYP